MAFDSTKNNQHRPVQETTLDPMRPVKLITEKIDKNEGRAMGLEKLLGF